MRIIFIIFISISFISCSVLKHESNKLYRGIDYDIKVDNSNQLSTREISYIRDKVSEVVGYKFKIDYVGPINSKTIDIVFHPSGSLRNSNKYGHHSHVMFYQPVVKFYLNERMVAIKASQADITGLETMIEFFKVPSELPNKSCDFFIKNTRGVLKGFPKIINSDVEKFILLKSKIKEYFKYNHYYRCVVNIYKNDDEPYNLRLCLLDFNEFHRLDKSLQSRMLSQIRNDIWGIIKDLDLSNIKITFKENN